MKKKIIALAILFSFALCLPGHAQNVRTTTYTANNSVSYLKSVLDYGKQRGWATQVQEQRLNNYMAVVTVADQSRIAAMIQTANTPSAKFFALKSLLGGDAESTVANFISRLNRYSEADQQRYCSVLQRQGLVQKWQYSCSIAVVLTYLMELSPRYAFEVKQVAGWDKIMNDPSNDMAVQEKQLLEQYGGKASARGDATGKSIGINGPINALVGKVLGTQFYAKQITGSVGDALNSIRALLQSGMNVPALIDFLPSHASHFVLFLRTKSEANQWWYLIYEPWEGKCDWVSTSTIVSNSFSPLLSQWQVQLRYYYPTTGK